MTKIVLKINCGDSNPPVLVENLLSLVFRCGFSAIFPFWYLSITLPIVLGAEMQWIASTHSWHAFVMLDFFIDLMFV